MSLKRQWVGGAIVVSLFAMLAGGCQVKQGLSDTYTRPAEINMAGRENVVFEGVSGPGQDAINSRLKAALQARGFTIVDREGGIAARNREDLLRATGQAQEGERESVTTGDVLIRGKVIRHDARQGNETGRGTTNGRPVTLYRAVGNADVEVSFDVVEVQTTKTITTQNVRGHADGTTEWAGGPVQIDLAPMLDQCYNQVAAEFMMKIAPHQVRVDHTLYSIKEVPQNESGVALLQAGDPTRAAAEFQAALDAAAAMPKPKKDAPAKITHNLAVAYERAGQFDRAAETYIKAASLGGKSEGPHAARCKQRQADIARLRDQGVAVK